MMTHLHNYTVVALDPGTREQLEQAFAAHDLPSDESCAMCGRRCWGKVCSACKHGSCDHSGSFAGYTLRGNGSPQAAQRCLTCGLMLSPLPRGATIYDLCVRNNLTRGDVPPCVRCGATTGTEMHHWAPQAIFNDADDWPVAPLCPVCHNTWHNALRAARGVSLPVDARIGQFPEWKQDIA